MTLTKRNRGERNINHKGSLSIDNLHTLRISSKGLDLELASEVMHAQVIGIMSTVEALLEDVLVASKAARNDETILHRMRCVLLRRSALKDHVVLKDTFVICMMRSKGSKSFALVAFGHVSAVQARVLLVSEASLVRQVGVHDIA